MDRKGFINLALLGSGGLALGGLYACKDSSPTQTEPPTDGGSNTNKYKEAGLGFLDFLHEKYYKSESGLYALHIDSQTYEKSQRNCYMWPAAHMMGALTWGAMINPSKYQDKLASYVDAIDWYRSGEAYGVSKNAALFFDDNGLVGNMLMNVYKNKIQTQEVLDKSLLGLKFNLKYRDERWGLPQTKEKLGNGIFYVGAVNGLANAYATYYTVSKNQEHLDIAKTYFDKLNDYDLKIKKPKTDLLISGSQYSDGSWDGFKVGPRASNTCAVIVLGARLYKITGDIKYLNRIKPMADAVLERWYEPNGGFSEAPFWGGAGAIDMLCEMYRIDSGTTKWYTAAKNIIDFLIDRGKDKKGFYPTGRDNNSYWNADRSNEEPPQKVKLLAQACAARAILRFAHLVEVNK